MHILEHFRDKGSIRIFDAGAGTGNWSRFVLTLGACIRTIMFDMNAHMLKIAKPKFSQGSENISFIEGNLEQPSDFPVERSNLILCMHNVIGLARNTEMILKNLSEYMEEDGLAFIMAMNKYHALNFNLKRSEEEVIRVIKDGTVKFKADMPEMFCYTPSEFKSLLNKAGFIDVTVLGFPITVYPTKEDTKLLHTETSISKLADPITRRELLAIEKRLCFHPELAYRAGSSLIAICKNK